LKPGVTREQAQADLETWSRNLPPDPRRRDDIVAQVKPLHEAMVADVRLPLLVFTGAVGLVLLIVCANVANLLLMRAVSRRQEIATRLALGASRGRLVRQLLTESALLAFFGGCTGVAIATLSGPSVLSVIPSGRLPQDILIRPDGWVLAFAAALSLLTGLIVGLAPIVQTTRDTHSAALREGPASATRGSYRLRHGLVVAQVALTLMLLVGAGLLLRSFTGLLSVPLGFTPERVMTMTVDLPVTQHPTSSEAAMFHDRLLAAISALPGVHSAGAVNWLPLGAMRIGGDVYAEDRPDLSGQYSATKVAVSPGYFRTIGIRLLRGRAFTAGDRRGSQPVAIISESVGRRLWPRGDSLGKRVSLRDNPKPEDWLTVVGVVEDVRQEGLRADPGHAVYQPYPQVTNRSWVGYMTFLVRTNGDPAYTAPLMRAALNQVDENEAPQSLATLESIIDRTVAEPKFQARVLTIFSLVALLLAVVGIYGVLASSVLERRFEIGIRLALGADRTAVVNLMLRQTMLLAAVGALLGLCGAVMLSGMLRSLLFNVTPTDPPTLLIATVVLMGAAFAAALIPARRASSIDPLVALRAE
jgi:putative ABC transport system permease protein